MHQPAKLLTVGTDQTACLQHGFGFEAKEVFIRKDAATGMKPPHWLN
jgi:hypothetical protein